MYILNTLGIVNFSNYHDELSLMEDENSKKGVKLYTANCIKKLVSKKKRRFQNEEFDLDLVYVTKRVLAMGFPSTGFESLYRNDINDVKKFFNKYHNSNVKVKILRYLDI